MFKINGAFYVKLKKASYSLTVVLERRGNVTYQSNCTLNNLQGCGCIEREIAQVNWLSANLAI